MKLTGCFFALIFIIAHVALSQPKLSLDKSEVDLGVIYSGMKKKGKIVLKNIGNDTLRIFSVQPSCGCTAVKQPKGFLLPNESDVAEVEFASAGYGGRVEKHVTITTNDPTSQKVIVKLIVNIKEILHPLHGSSRVFFNNPPLDTTSTQKLSLINVSGEPMHIKGVSIQSPNVQVILGKERLKPNDTLEIQIVIKPEKIGYTDTPFTIETDNKNQTQVKIQVQYYISKVN